MVQIPGLILGNIPKKNHRLKRWSKDLIALAGFIKRSAI